MTMLAAENGGVRTLIDELLDQQRDLTAVRRFSRWHEDHSAEPALAGHYRDLIPLTLPRAGEQYAFEVDLDKCSGCKACVSACHSLNGLDEGELWRSVGMLLGESRSSSGNFRSPDSVSAVLQHVTTACHHCVEPGCADGCPVLAYEKDPLTGIVRHLDDQCIGCQYCILKCPYDVPKFSKAKGIVRKCDMCQSRLAVGEAPACVQACPHEAIRISNVRVGEARARRHATPMRSPGDTDSVSGRLSSNGYSDRHLSQEWLPDSPSAEITLPTTRYVSARPLSGKLRSADSELLRLEPAHWPLVWMLVLTQLAAGLHLLHALLSAGGWLDPLRILAGAATATLLVGLAVSVAHLGRPLKAWRVFLGWRRSWMSREIIAFSAYAAVAVVVLLVPGRLLWALLTAMLAILAVACSAMIYSDTRRPAWRAEVVFIKFFGTTLLLGATGGAAWAGWFVPALAPALGAVATVIRTGLFAWEWKMLLGNLAEPWAPGHRTALTLVGLMRPLLMTRIGLFAASTLFSVLAIFEVGGQGAIWGSIACGTTVTSQVLERYAFFVACAPPRMPGGVAG